MQFFVNSIFPFLLLCLGVVYLAEKFYFKPQRANIINQISVVGHPLSDEDLNIINKTGFWVNTANSWFPLIFFIFIFRAFFWESFQIPSGSMTPTLYKGDYVLVNKHSYGLKNPFTGLGFVDFEEPKRGDPIVFQYPLDPALVYIKRVIGLPGERIAYKDKVIKVFTQEKEFVSTSKSAGIYYDKVSGADLEYFIESLDDASYQIAIDHSAKDDTGRYHNEGGVQIEEFVIPDDYYFVLGDNRDNSLDSRYWGLVHKEAIKGKAQSIWLSFEFDGIEGFPAWIPSGVSFKRIGWIK